MVAVGFAPQNPPPAVMRCSNTGKPVSALAPRYCSLATHYPWLVVNPQSPCSDLFALSIPNHVPQSMQSVVPKLKTLSIGPRPVCVVHLQTAARLLHASRLQPVDEIQHSAS